MWYRQTIVLKVQHWMSILHPASIVFYPATVAWAVKDDRSLSLVSVILKWYTFPIICKDICNLSSWATDLIAFSSSWSFQTLASIWLFVLGLVMPAILSSALLTEKYLLFQVIFLSISFVLAVKLWFLVLLQVWKSSIGIWKSTQVSLSLLVDVAGFNLHAPVQLMHL